MNLRTTLFDHQRRAVDKLLPTRVGALFMDMGTGKALPLDARVLTPTGWRLMGDIDIGTQVIGSNGKPCSVSGVFPQGTEDVYRLTFSDGATAECSKAHLWRVITPLRKNRGYPDMVLSVAEMLERGIKHANGNRKYQIPLVSPVEFSGTNTRLPVDPYLLGVFLGNGYFRNTDVSLSSADGETLSEVERLLPQGVIMKQVSRYDFAFVGTKRGTNPLVILFRDLGLTNKRAAEKFVPECYLFASVADRLDLLRGLLDTDGSASGAGVEFTTASPRLAQDVKFLVQSLGGLVSVAQRYPGFTYNGAHKQGQLSYRLYIRFTNKIQPFRLSRKRVTTRTKYDPIRAIEKIEYVGRKETQCIQVDAPDGLFVIDDFVVTHNTRAAIELVARRRARIDHAVIFCPVSLKETWRYEIGKHTDASPADICVFDDQTNMRTLPTADWYIIGIESISSSNRVTLAANALITEHTYVIVDESSYIKGHNARRTQRLTAMSARARYRLLLTGTPLSQGVVDLFAQMRFLSPAILGYKSFYSFAANHLEYSDRYPGLIVAAHNVPHLAAKIQPYTYQVSKAECLDLPDKLYDCRYYGMTVAQRETYEYAKQILLLDLADDEINSYTIFRLFSALQQIVSGFWNLGAHTQAVPHLRLDMLDDAIAGIPADCRVIIWCKYLYSLDQIAGRLAAAHGPEAVAVLHGNLDERGRHAEVERFRTAVAPGARFLVATQATGGHGLTLNEAHYVVFYENGFKYSERVQAEDRCHRIGQTQPVTYVDLICRHSIDERIQKALSAKEDVVESFRRQVQRIRDEQGSVKDLARDL